MRTDIHRPSVIEPADYDFVGFEVLRVDDIGDAMFLQMERQRIRAHREQTGGAYSSHEHGGNCHICGAHAMYTALFYHRLSNVYVRTGLECAENLECGEVAQFRRQLTHALEAQAGKRKAIAILERAGLDKAWEIYTAQDSTRREESIIIDIVGRLVKYGSVSDAQLSFIRKLLDTVSRRAEIDAQRAAELEAAQPVPVTDQRIVIRGKVLTIRSPDYDRGDWGPLRMLVQHADGWKVWGSVPASLEVTRGDTIEFSAKVKASDKDPKFGFFSRPTKATKIVEEV